MNVNSITLFHGINLSNPYVLLSGACITLILTYFFQRLPQRTYLPPVILLPIIGILISFGLEQAQIDTNNLMPFLEVVCVIALIIVVLETSMGLNIKKGFYSTIGHSLLSATLCLIATTFVIANILYIQLVIDYEAAVLIAIPLSVFSSSTVISYVTRLVDSKTEFIIYESSFSDIIGIIIFYCVVFYLQSGENFVPFRFFASVVLTILGALIASAILINIFKKFNSRTKLLLLISNLVLLYTLANLFNLSLLVIVMIYSTVFGLVLANHDTFKKYFQWFEIGTESKERTEKEFHLITSEAAYLVRVFFLVVFGMTIDVSNLLSIEVLLTAIVIVACIFILRVLVLHYFTRTHFLPKIYLAPRGLVTILLFFQIPDEFIASDLKPGIIFYVIIFTNLVMTLYLNKDKMNRNLPNDDKVPWKEPPEKHNRSITVISGS